MKASFDEKYNNVVNIYIFQNVGDLFNLLLFVSFSTEIQQFYIYH